MTDERRSLLLVRFEQFVSVHRHCGGLTWDTQDGEDGFAVEVHANCLGCDASFLESATASEVAFALIHSRLLTSGN
jgi:hypothetical protein